jgi:polysaccharide biosynthesis protein PslJ
MEFQVSAAILGLVISLAVVYFAPGLLAGLLWAMLAIYGTTLPAGTGLIVCALGMAVIAFRCRSSRDVAWLQKSAGLWLILAAGLLVTARMYMDSGSFAAYSLAMPVAVAISLFILFIGLSAIGRVALVRGVVLGVSVVSGAEVLRVASGGAIHPSEAAFGINPITIGQFAALGVLLAIFMIEQGIARTVNALALIICAAGIAVTNSRGPLLGLSVALLIKYVPLWFKNEKQSDYHWRPMIPILTMITAVVALSATSDQLYTWFRASDQDGNAAGRLDAWSKAIDSIVSSPLVGQGADRYNMGNLGAASGLPTFPHNVFLEIWSEYGLVPFAFLVIGVIITVRRSGEAGRPIALAFVICFSISGSLDTSLGLWVALAIALTLTPISEQVHLQRMSHIRRRQRVSS